MPKHLCTILFAAAVSASANPCQPIRTIDLATMTYHFAVCDAPDLDQIRAEVPPFFPGLPNSGTNYCVPTSTMNWFVFLANRLTPALNVAPGPGYYGPEQCNSIGPCPQYEKATSALTKLGIYMSTDPKTGTRAQGFIDGSKQWLTDNGLQGLIVPSTYYIDFNGGENGNTLAVRMSHSAVAGHLVIPILGWYKRFQDLTLDKQTTIVLSFPDTLSGWWRDGGHALTLTQIDAAPLKDGAESPTFGLSNPADGGTSISQSAFVTVMDSPIAKSQVLNGYEVFVEQSSRYEKRTAFYDGYYALKPGFVLSVEGPKVHYYSPLDVYTGGSAMRSFSSATGGRVLEIAAHPETGRHTYIAEGSSALYQLDPLTGRTLRFADVPGAQKLVFGDSDEKLFVLTRGELMAIDTGGKIRQRTTLRFALDGIAYDFQRKRLTGISLTDQKLYSFGQDLSVRDAVSIRQPLCTAGYQFKYNPADHSFFGHCDGSATVAQFLLSDKGFLEKQFTLEGVRAPIGLTVNDQGHLFTGDGGLLKEFDEAMRPVSKSVWAKVPASGPMDMLRSYRGYDSRYGDTFMYDNVLPPAQVGGSAGRK